MSLFDIIKYPVDHTTFNFSHLPKDIWTEYMERYAALDQVERIEERATNNLLIKTIREWDE